MPYIEKSRRDDLDSVVPDLTDIGDVNYLVTKILSAYFIQKGTKYRTHNDIIGVLECIKQEWYRRMTIPYEDYKCELNGDVYDGNARDEGQRGDRTDEDTAHAASIRPEDSNPLSIGAA